MDRNIHILEGAFSHASGCKVRQKIKAAESGGFTKALFSEMNECLFYASSTRGNVLIIDVRNGNILSTYKGHAAPINDLVESVHHSILVTAGDDFTCNVYDLMVNPEKKKYAIEKQKEEVSVWWGSMKVQEVDKTE